MTNNLHIIGIFPIMVFYLNVFSLESPRSPTSSTAPAVVCPVWLTRQQIQSCRYFSFVVCRNPASFLPYLSLSELKTHHFDNTSNNTLHCEIHPSLCHRLACLWPEDTHNFGKICRFSFLTWVWAFTLAICVKTKLRWLIKGLYQQQFRHKGCFSCFL
jgi:hypothetical protein